STEMTADLPRVRVVILSFDGGPMTIDCLESLMRTEWPPDRLEIVMVDNGSLDNITPRVRSAFPSVRVLEPLSTITISRRSAGHSVRISDSRQSMVICPPSNDKMTTRTRGRSAVISVDI
ncbi:MAG: glycosyltransferase family 2 protein, partial [Actinomycetota bacterium]